ncbi:kinase-like protein [Pseudovirgaria hyperparasitica]|uniref:non-specific serine/threonine protein kinase n=1 Tax=Pseudovirgaria hyperparasitica TaxID=470096 RepID=A0A6A6WBB1_9PEZI|nr:kinase-like protein [Pseudovirgaria hyperparasitica]KAF2759250.1 kinase-like protein [Pseudovirgaria hyperparasitica]
MATQAQGFGSRRSNLQEDESTRIGDFRKLENIGKGSFAIVYRGEHVVRREMKPDPKQLALKNRALVAIKSVHLQKLNRKLRDNLVTEINILRSLQHPHIVALIDCQESPKFMNIVMEFCELGDLSNFIRKRHHHIEHPATKDMVTKYPCPPAGGLHEVVAHHFSKQIASALEFLHAKNFIHRDLKPQNLLLNPSPRYYHQYKPTEMPYMPTKNSLVPATGVESLPMLKVADFGFARFLPQTSLAETLCGSPLYMAPEILRYEKYDAKADLWSVGTVMYEMMVGKPPFKANNHVELLKKIERQEDRIRFPEDLIIGTQMKTLIRALLRRKPVERIGFESYFDDPLIRGPIPNLVGDDRPASERETTPPPDSKVGTRAEQKRPSTSSRAPSDLRRQSLDHTHPKGPQGQAVVGSAPTSRPSSRATTTTKAPRRLSYTPTPDADLARQQQRRPIMTSHPTAPARQTVPSRPASQNMDRHSGRNSVSPTSSVHLKEHLDAQRIPRGAEDRSQRDGRDRTDQEIAFEREYVMVEKRSVEVNALADEMAATPGGRPNSQHNAMVRRATTQGSPTSTTGAHVLPSRAISIAQGKSRPDSTHARTGSYERRYGRIPGSVSSAISNALNAVALRSGMGLSPPLGTGPSPPKGYAGFPSYPTAQSSILMIGDAVRTSDPKDEESKTLKFVEDLAHRSNVVYGFAEVKYKQLIPATPSEGLGIANKTATNNYEDDDDDLTVDATMTISEEALVLYVKAVAILGKGIDIAGSWWLRRNRLGDRSSPSNASASAQRLTHVVQWLRSRFNECIDKAEFSARKLVEAQKALPSDHHLHPSNRPAASGSSTSIGSTENIFLPTGVTAEKLMYDRAIEMSKAAAVNELVGEDLPGCELNYGTAIQMLQAILDTEDESADKSDENKSHKSDADTSSSLELEDKEAIKKLIDSMKSRLKTLRKKIEIQKAQKRASLSAPRRPSSNSSPSTTPNTGTTPAQR